MLWGDLYDLGGLPFLFFDNSIIHWGSLYDPSMTMVIVGDLSVLVSFAKRLCGGYEEHLNERNKLAEDEPDVDVLDVGRLGQGLHHRDENCCQDQHVGQVHSQGCLNEMKIDKFVAFQPIFGSLQSTLV